MELHPLDGFYDMIQLQHHSEKSLNPPWTHLRVSMNRPGSLRVLAPTGDERWVWRGIWNHMANGSDPDDAARIIGGIAGLPNNEETGTTHLFPEMAATLLELVAESTWAWQCGWCDGHVAGWIDKYRSPLRQYQRDNNADLVPPLGRIWGAVHNGDAAVIVDQENLRTWAWDGTSPVEISHENPLDRIADAVEIANI